MPPRRLLFALLLFAAAGMASAADVCGGFARDLQSMQYADRIAGVACYESLLWYSPFIDDHGRLASITVSEAESARLSDGATPAWKRVAVYWRESALLGRMAGFPGATDCAYAEGPFWQSASCRAFLVDHPWSAAFVSYVMTRAGVPGFRNSPSHVDFVRDAYARPDESPFAFADPLTTPARPGDLLCFVRASTRVYGFAGLGRFLADNPGVGLKMHCDVVVANGGGLLSAVGGNVLQGVTLRQLPVNRNGLPWALPLRTETDPPCRPDAPDGCNFNRQDWAALLRLKPLPPATSPVPLTPLTPTATPECCVNCVVGEDVPRCPGPSTVPIGH